jgi:hypothetical protein
MESSQRGRRVEPTDEWEQIELLCGWPEQRDYELIRPMVLFGAPADGRSQETGESSGRTLLLIHRSAWKMNSPKFAQPRPSAAGLLM